MNNGRAELVEVMPGVALDISDGFRFVAPDEGELDLTAEQFGDLKTGLTEALAMLPELVESARLARSDAEEDDDWEPVRRTDEEIGGAEGEFFDHVWYNRKLVYLENIIDGRQNPAPQDIMDGMAKAMRECENRYGKDNLGPYDDFEWGMINGKLSALRWVLGDDWDMLDT
jgi:hypothetical protein